jgi:hypothetical protein
LRLSDIYKKIIEIDAVKKKTLFLLKKIMMGSGKSNGLTVKLGIVGFIARGIFGFLYRPSAFIIGQLPRFFKGNLLSFFNRRRGLCFFSRKSREISFCLRVTLWPTITYPPV